MTSSLQFDKSLICIFLLNYYVQLVFQLYFYHVLSSSAVCWCNIYCLHLGQMRLFQSSLLFAFFCQVLLPISIFCMFRFTVSLNSSLQASLGSAFFPEAGDTESVGASIHDPFIQSRFICVGIKFRFCFS